MAGTVVICFTDIVGSTALLSRVGDDAFDSLRRDHFALLAHSVDAHGGEVVKNLGDGIMATFGSASAAVAGAVAMQQDVDAAARRAGPDSIAIRIGISAGDASQEDGDWFGAPVVESARLCSVAEAGQILVSEVVRLLAGSRGGHELVPLGERELKGLPAPLAVSEVTWRPSAPAAAGDLPGPLAPTEGELPFSGRSDVYEQVRATWKRSAAGETRIVLIGGEPGVGKTRLVSEAAREVHADGAVVLLGRADEHIDAPFGPWREALRRLVPTLPDEVVAAHVGTYGGELVRLVPELRTRVDGLTAPTDTDAETERLLLFEAVVGLLSRVSAAAPVLLVLDDIHWADRSSLLLLLHVLRSDRAAALLVVATYRDTEVDRAHPLSEVLADLRRVPAATRVALGGLDDQGLRELLAGAGGHELDDRARDFATALWRETEGNPFFVGEVLRHLIESGGLVQDEGRWRATASLAETGLPEGVREVIGRRLSALPERTEAMLGVGALLGREFDVALLGAAADETVADVFDALAPAEDARLIAEVDGAPGRYAFSHALVQATLAEELGTNRRIRLHRAAGLALEATADPSVGALAYHFGECAVMGETERAVRYARSAAEEALALAAPADAATFVSRALQAVELAGGGDRERAPLLLLLATAQDAIADPAAMDTCAAAFDAAVTGGDHELAVEAAVAYAGPSAFLFDERGERQLRRALDLLDPGDSELRAHVLARLGKVLALDPGDEAVRLARESFAMAGRVGSAHAQRHAARSIALTMRHRDRHAQLEFAELALTRREGPFALEDFEQYSLAVEALLSLGDPGGVPPVVERLRRDFERSSIAALVGARALSRSILAQIEITLAFIAGRFDLADEVVAGLHDEPLGPEYLLGPITENFGRCQVAWLRGDWPASSHWWQATKDVIPGAFDVYFGYLGSGRPLPEVRGYWDEWRTVDHTRPAITRASNVSMVAEALRRLGEGEASAAYADEFASHSGCFITNTVAYFHGPYDTAFGILSTTAGRLDRAVAFLERGVAQCDAIGSPSFGSVARLELATTLRLRGHGDDDDRAEALCDEVHRTTEALGMTGWTQRVERLAAGDLAPWRLAGDT
ncbi:MAG: AAA family ATPase [Acidimicrobiales bacterium]|nr:AAA family ATPase [Acidimicrobiales bacterium]